MPIVRRHALAHLRRLVRTSRVTAVLGPRQCGKSTLVGQLGAAHVFDLEDPRDLQRFETPMLLFEELRGLVVIDEVQRRPELFPVLRVVADRRRDLKLVVTGSASPALLQQTSESLAGRVAYFELGGLELVDLTATQQQRAWLRGRFPRALLAESDAASLRWRQDYVTSVLERDLPQLGVRVPAPTLRRFWQMLAHYHGQLLNRSELGAALGVDEKTIKHYLDVLEGALLIRQLPPWFENLGKRVVKRPKVYVRDAGLLHALLGIETRAQLLGHPKLGFSWEGHVVEAVASALGERGVPVHFWQRPSVTDLDLVYTLGGRRYGVEIKYADAPGYTRTLRTAVDDLGLHHVHVIVPGGGPIRLDAKVTVTTLPPFLASLAAR